MEALGLNGASNWTPTWRGCLRLVLRCRIGLPVDWGNTIIGVYVNSKCSVWLISYAKIMRREGLC